VAQPKNGDIWVFAPHLHVFYGHFQEISMAKLIQLELSRMVFESLKNVGSQTLEKELLEKEIK